MQCEECFVELTDLNLPKRFLNRLSKYCKTCWNAWRRKNAREDGRLKQEPCKNCGVPCVKLYGLYCCSVKCRFLSFTEKQENGCWVWKGTKNWYSYGKFRHNNKMYRAHRFSYELFKDKIPHGKIVCHSCDYTSCVNPDHLWIGTMKENVQDMIKKGRTMNKIVLGLKGK
jgi:hypothetical protein